MGGGFFALQALPLYRGSQMKATAWDLCAQPE